MRKIVEIAHGTRNGYQQCVKRDEGSCVDCRTAAREYVATLTTDIPHGTLYGYLRCHQRPEGSCGPCRAAHADRRKKVDTPVESASDKG